MGQAYEKGLVLYRQQRYRQAIEQFKAELSSMPNSVQSHAMLSLSLLNDKKPEPAYAEASEALRINPQYAFAHYAMSFALLHKTTRKTFWSLELSFSSRAQASEWRKRYRAALKAISQALALSPGNADFLAHQAMLLGALGQWRKSLDAANRGLSSNPNHINCANRRALALNHLGHADDAEAEIGRTLAINPEHPWTHRTRGWLLLQSGKHLQARRHFEEALRLDPSNGFAKRGLFHAKAARFAPYRWFLQLMLWASIAQVRPFTVLIFVAAGVTYALAKLRFGELTSGLFAGAEAIGLLIIAKFLASLLRRFRRQTPRPIAPKSASSA